MHAHYQPAFLRPLRRGETRTEAQLRDHYKVERELANRLRQATRVQRQRLYSEVYCELLRRVPHHPRLRVRDEAATARQRQDNATQLLAFLRRFVSPECALMELGAGDCALAFRACKEVRQVYAVEVANQLPPAIAPPPNFQLVLIDGYRLPLPDGAADVALSDQLMEHLHPEDAEDQLREIFRCLRSRGVYVCLTPNRLCGPRDISEYFDEVATGMHLREYSAREIRALFLRAGFARLRFYVAARGRFFPFPYPLLAFAERLLDALPFRLRKRLADSRPGRALLMLRVAAFKA